MITLTLAEPRLEDASLLAKWRNDHRHWFINKDEVTPEGTLNWLSTISNKHIFFITHEFNKLGCIGAHYDLVNRQFELERLIRGEKGGPPDMMRQAEIMLLKHYKNKMFRKATLRVYPHNYFAKHIHESVGFEHIGLIDGLDHYRLKLEKWDERKFN